MPTLLPMRARPPSILDPLLFILHALRLHAASAAATARGILAEEAARPRRRLEDFIGEAPLRTAEGKRVRARDAEARAWDL